MRIRGRVCAKCDVEYDIGEQLPSLEYASQDFSSVSFL